LVENPEPNPELVESRDPDRNFKEKEWVVVRFSLLQQSGKCRWLGQIVRENENRTFTVSFLWSKRTRDHCGYVYVYPPMYPEKPDEEIVMESQILYTVPPPEKYQKFLLFTVHWDKL